MTYKGIEVTHHENLKILELHVKESNIHDDVSYVEKIVIFIELVHYIKPKYIVFNKLDTDFDIQPHLHEFTIKNVLPEMRYAGVKKNYFLIKGELNEKKPYFNDWLFTPFNHWDEITDDIFKHSQT